MSSGTYFSGEGEVDLEVSGPVRIGGYSTDSLQSGGFQGAGREKAYKCRHRVAGGDYSEARADELTVVEVYADGAVVGDDDFVDPRANPNRAAERIQTV